jgi:hypothetical protein
VPTLRNAIPTLTVLLAVLVTAAIQEPVTAQVPAQGRPAAVSVPDLTTPAKQFGHDIGADYTLPNYRQLTEYWQVLAAESDRMELVEIGRTAEGRSQLMAVVTSPENHARLDRYKGIAERLARAEGVTEAEARDLAHEGRAVVWIDGGLHATEVLGAQQLMETLWQMVSGTDDETLRILNDVIILFVHANPDGHDLVADWYMRNPEPTERSTNGVPRLYQKYIGHDNNRDFYASTQAETENMNRVLYREWYPQITYNHHQTGPPGAVMFAPPFRDPFNYVYDPLVVTGIDLVGSAMHNRFAVEGKGGVVRRRGANYSTWWNGGLRTTVYFHNMIGLLTETIGNPTPIEIPTVTTRILPNGDMPNPIQPQAWHFRQSIDYSVTANRAVLDVASRYRETFLFNIWRAGMNSIERGSQDHWTVYPKSVDALKEALGTDESSDFASLPGGLGGMPGPIEDYELLHKPELRDPRGYILSADQPDFPTAGKLVNALLETGVTVHRATAPFTVEGRSYPVGSYVVKTAQAFRPHVLDMFEPQDHPNDFAYPGSPPTPPYDNAGWTLAYQMGVQFDRVLDGFDGPFEVIEDWNVSPPPGAVASADGAEGFLFSHAVNDAFKVINRLESSGEEVYWLLEPHTSGGTRWDAGTLYVASRRGTASRLEALATETGVHFVGVPSKPDVEALRLRPTRIALWDTYGGSMPSGWIRWILEQWEYADVEVVFPPQLDEGDLNDDYDVIILPDGAVGTGGGFARFFASMPQEMIERLMRQFGFGPPDPETVPEEWRVRMGSVSDSITVPILREFLEDGGTIVTIGHSTQLADKLGLPVGNALIPEGGEEPVGREEYYVPGSILEVAVDRTHPVAHGIGDRVDVMFDNSPVMSVGQNSGLDRIAWFDKADPLRSGWGWGQHHLEGGVAVAAGNVGEGNLFLFGPEVTFRAQPHGTFKFLFNALALSTAEARRP